MAGMWTQIKRLGNYNYGLIINISEVNVQYQYISITSCNIFGQGKNSLLWKMW